MGLAGHGPARSEEIRMITRVACHGRKQKDKPASLVVLWDELPGQAHAAMQALFRGWDTVNRQSDEGRKLLATVREDGLLLSQFLWYTA